MKSLFPVRSAQILRTSIWQTPATSCLPKRTKFGYFWMFPLFYFLDEKPLG